MPATQLPLVLLTNAVPADLLAALDGRARVMLGPEGGDIMSREDVLKHAPTAAAIINQGELRVDRELLDAAPRLRIVANVAIGVDNMDRPLMASRGVFASNAPHAFVDATADLAFALVLAVARRLVEADRYARAGSWKSFQPGVWDGVLLQGKTLGLVGYGAIGRAVAARALAFGMRVLHYRRTPTGAPGYTTLDALLAESDFVSLHLPLNQDSRGLFNAACFSRMKRGAFLINTARGRVVEEQALVDALQSGHLAGAGLDVFEDEPRIHPALPAMKNVVLTPHLGGGTHESRCQARLVCIQDVARVLAGQPPLYPCNDPVPAKQPTRSG